MTSRRRFAQQAGLFASAALVAPVVLAQARHKMGLQLFTIRDAMARDVPGTLKSIAAMGYQEVGRLQSLRSAFGCHRQGFAARLRDNGSESSGLRPEQA